MPPWRSPGPPLVCRRLLLPVIDQGDTRVRWAARSAIVMSRGCASLSSGGPQPSGAVSRRRCKRSGAHPQPSGSAQRPQKAAAERQAVQQDEPRRRGDVHRRPATAPEGLISPPLRHPPSHRGEDRSTGDTGRGRVGLTNEPGYGDFGVCVGSGQDVALILGATPLKYSQRQPAPSTSTHGTLRQRSPRGWESARAA